MPALWGGEDGAALTRSLLSAGFGSAMLLISGYSNPRLTLAHAAACGYAVADFLVQPLPFGAYSSQPLVADHLAAMRDRGEAFFRDGGAARRWPYYFLAGVLFQRRRDTGAGNAPGAQQQHQHGQEQEQQPEVVDLSDELLSVLTAL